MKFLRNLIQRLPLNIALLLCLSMVVATPVFAGTDLTVSCPSIGSCNVLPASTPLLDEGGWCPGAETTQRFTVSDISSQDGYVAVEVDNYTDSKDLGEIIEIEIHEATPGGDIIYGGVTMHQFRDDGYFTIDGVNSGQTIDYYLTARMPVTAGNEYQGSGLDFDLNLGLELLPLPPQSGGGDGTGTVLGSTSPASPPVCTAQIPDGAPGVSIVSLGTNTVTLSWTPVTPATHYALIFRSNITGIEYGSPNIGNVTTYTINALSGGADYTFEVFGINDCAPGDRGTAVSAVIPGPVLTTRPTGPGGEVLGVVEDATPSEEVIGEETTGEVLGETDAQCVEWKFYLPLILLLVQLLVILVGEVTLRSDHGPTKHFVAPGVTLASIGLFYWLRECRCYSLSSILALLCKWYWVVSVALTVIMKAISYAFIEEVK